MHHSAPVMEPETETRSRRGKTGGVGVAAKEGGYRLEYSPQGNTRHHLYDAHSDEDAIREAGRFLKIPTGELKTPLFRTLFKMKGGTSIIRLADNQQIYPPRGH